MESIKKISIIVIHWAMDEFRSRLMRDSIFSLIKTTEHLNPEIIVVDNGDNKEDSRFLLDLTESGKIASYIRNRKNVYFGFARNQAIYFSSGDYLVIADNDIIYENSWLDECVEFLDKNEGKYFTTPLLTDPMNRRSIRWRGEVYGWKLNERAGSNCTVARKKDFLEVGYYENHRIAGSKWTDAYLRKGYLMACMPQPKAKDVGFRKGYNFNKEIENLSL